MEGNMGEKPAVDRVLVRDMDPPLFAYRASRVGDWGFSITVQRQTGRYFLVWDVDAYEPMAAKIAVPASPTSVVSGVVRSEVPGGRVDVG
jgi:hypothetical protein